MLDLVAVGAAVVLAGILVIFLATVLASRGEESEEGRSRVGVKGGGVFMIGPIPIIFGSDAKWTAVAIALAIVLVVLTLLLTREG